MYRPMQVILLRVSFERVWVAFGSPSVRLLFCRRSSLFTGDRLRLGGLLALFSSLTSSFPPIFPLLPCALDSLSTHGRIGYPRS